jgi:hypothetical protein
MTCRNVSIHTFQVGYLEHWGVKGKQYLGHEAQSDVFRLLKCVMSHNEQTAFYMNTKKFPVKNDGNI